MISQSGVKMYRNIFLGSVVSYYKYWKWETVTDGTDGHICIDRFRFVKEDGTYGVPSSVTVPQGTNVYSDVGQAFNIQGWGSSTSNDEKHWCAWGLTIVQMEFAEPTKFVSYKFETHSNLCTNDPQEWKIKASNDGSTWAVVDHQDRNCHSNPIAREGYNEFQIPVPTELGKLPFHASFLHINLQTIFGHMACFQKYYISMCFY